MSDANPGATKTRGEVAVWVARQSEPFELIELRAHFGLGSQRSVRMANWLVAAGYIRLVRPSQGASSAVYERTK